jgi:hypothetical protein
MFPDNAPPVPVPPSSVPIPTNPQTPPTPEPQQPHFNPNIITSKPAPSPNHPKSPVLGIAICLLFTIIVLGLASFTAYAAYSPSRPSFISASTQKNLALFVYHLPLTPKTPKLILLATANTPKVLTTYTPDLSISANISSTAVSTASLDLRLQGPIDFSNPQNPKFDVAASINLNVMGTSYKSQGHIRGLDKKAYFKIDVLPDNLPIPVEAQKLTPIFANWITYDTTGLDTEARNNLDQASQKQSLIDSTRQKIQDILQNDTVLKEVKLIGTETINGVPTYHLHVNPSQAALRQIASQLTPTEKELATNTQYLSIDVWFGIQDSLPRKLTFQSITNLPTMSTASSMFGDLNSSKLSLSVVLTLNDIGKPASVSVPSPTMSTTEFTQAINAALLPSAPATPSALTNP